jgi:hypothetical protein
MPVLTVDELSIFGFGRSVGMDTHTPEEMARTLADFQKVQGRALVIGGVAVIHHGYRRYTHDVDVLYSYHDAGILSRLEADFKVVLRAENGWHHLEHRATGVRLELIPEGGLTTYGFIPAPQTAGGENGVVSLSGLIWLKLVSGRSKDDADVVEVAKVRMAEVEACRAELPSELHERFDELIARAKRELAFDPSRNPNLMPPPDRVQEAPAKYAGKPRSRRRRTTLRKAQGKKKGRPGRKAPSAAKRKT